MHRIILALSGRLHDFAQIMLSVPMETPTLALAQQGQALTALPTPTSLVLFQTSTFP